MVEADLKVVELNSLDQKEIFNFAKNAYSITNDPAHVNMWSENWETDSATFPYLIYKSPRFANGNGIFHALLIDDKIEAVCGINRSSFDSYVALGGVRSWVNPKYRGRFLIGGHIMPLQLKWAEDNNLKTVCLTFNSYNEPMLKIVKRTGVGRKKNRRPGMMFYNGLHEVSFPCNIQSTKQYVIYHKIDESYTPDWQKIKWVDK